MPSSEKPRIVVSRCLGFETCRYDGLVIRNAFVEKLREYAALIPVCPEMEIGLGVPRNPIRVVETGVEARLQQLSTGRDFTAEMNSFADAFLGSLGGIDGFLLKGRSPSCGITDVKIYNENGTVTGKGAGFFARAVLKRFPETPVEDEDRLDDSMIRERFLIRVFTSARFRAARDTRSIRGLVRFQNENKLLLMAYNQTVMRELGRIAANREGKPAETVIAEYGRILQRAFLRNAPRTSHIDVLMHAMGYFSERLASEEKSFFLDTLDLFRAGETPLFDLTSVIRSWITRFHEPYLAAQTYFAPYPEELAETYSADAPHDVNG